MQWTELSYVSCNTMIDFYHANLRTNVLAASNVKLKDDFQSVLRSLRTLMFINIINGSLDGMRIDVIP